MVYAIASRAGCAICLRNVDDDSIDLSLASRLFPRKPVLDVQLKCTGQDVLSNGYATLRLSRKNYDDLRYADVLVPRILILVLVPNELNDWIEQTEDQLILRRCGYWMSIAGAPPSENSSGENVRIPQTNTFNTDSLTALMQSINDGVAL